MAEPPSFEGKPSITETTDVKHGDKTAYDEAYATEGTSFLIDHVAERKLVWKFDTRILPVLAIMYLFNSLDKSNLGNAKTDGLEDTLNLIGDQYNIILSVFFVPYVLTAPFLGILGKKYGPNRVLPIMMFCFGAVTTMVTVVKNFAGLMTIRWFLGMAESAFFPLVIYYQTTYIASKNHSDLKVLSSRRTCPTPWVILCRPIDCFRIWRVARVWRFPNPIRPVNKLALFVPHRRSLHSLVLSVRLLVSPVFSVPMQFLERRGKVSRVLSDSSRLLEHRKRKV
jgi:hypothetical protein